MNKWLIAQFPKQITPFPSSMWEANGASHVPSLPLQWPGTTPNWSCHVMCTVEVPGQFWFLFTNFLKHDAFSLSLSLSECVIVNHVVGGCALQPCHILISNKVLTDTKSPAVQMCGVHIYYLCLPPRWLT